MSPEECAEIPADYVLFIESSCGLDVKGVEERLSERYKGRVVDIIGFFELVVNRIDFQELNLVFFGNKDMYESRFWVGNLFAGYEYVSENEINEKAHVLRKADMIMICTEWYMSEKDMYDQVRKSIRMLKKVGISRERVYSHLWSEYLAGLITKCKTTGELNPDKKFLVFHPRRFVGIALHMRNALEVIEYANKNDMIPVADMKNYPNIYSTSTSSDNKQLRSDNPWEWFFEKLSPYDLDEVYKSKNVWLYKHGNIPGPMASVDEIKVTDDFRIKLENEYRKLFPADSDRVLGVVYRGTDYYAAAGHPVPMEPERFMDRVADIMNAKNYDHIFLATEVQEITEKFKERFGDKVFFTDQKRFSSSTREYLAKIHFERENDEYKKGFEYLLVLMLLRRCKGIVGPYCGAFVFASQDNEQLEYTEIIQNQRIEKKSRKEQCRIFGRKLWRYSKRKLQLGQYRH